MGLDDEFENEDSDERTVRLAASDPVKLCQLLRQWSGLFESGLRATKAGSDLLMAAARMIEQLNKSGSQNESKV